MDRKEAKECVFLLAMCLSSLIFGVIVCRTPISTQSQDEHIDIITGIEELQIMEVLDEEIIAISLPDARSIDRSLAAKETESELYSYSDYEINEVTINEYISSDSTDYYDLYYSDDLYEGQFYEEEVIYAPQSVDIDTSDIVDDVILSDDISDSESSSADSDVSSNIDYDDVYSVAWNLYGMSEVNVTKALRLITYEGYELDGYFNYLMACTVVNHYLNDPGKELYSNWGGSDSFYNEWNFAGRSIAGHAYTALLDALLNLNTSAWACHGIVPENGYYSSCQHLDEAIYISYAWVNVGWSGKIFGIWSKNAKWY